MLMSRSRRRSRERGEEPSERPARPTATTTTTAAQERELTPQEAEALEPQHHVQPEELKVEEEKKHDPEAENEREERRFGSILELLQSHLAMDRRQRVRAAFELSLMSGSNSPHG